MYMTFLAFYKDIKINDNIDIFFKRQTKQSIQLLREIGNRVTLFIF